MDKINTALKILENDRVNNICVINFIKNNRISSIDIIGNSVLVRGVSDRRWVYLSCKDKEELIVIKNKLNKEDDNFATIADWMFPILTEGKEIIWDLSMIQFYLPDDVQITSPKYETVPLTDKDAQTVYNNSEYKEYISIEYVTDCLMKGISAGLYENGKLVSWAITQDDGAIGFLHTLDNFRRKGYGYSVTASMIHEVRNNGGLPFANVKASNKRSINLLLKLGFKENKIVHWLQIK